MAMLRMLQIYGKSWPGYVGGYDSWAKRARPNTNIYAFTDEVEELRRATMLEL